MLLDDAMLSSGPAATMQFEAVVVLLGGRWPARGLISGRWPPLSDPPAVSSSAAEVSQGGASSSFRGDDAVRGGGGRWRPRALSEAVVVGSAPQLVDIPSARVDVALGGASPPRQLGFRDCKGASFSCASGHVVGRSFSRASGGGFSSRGHTVVVHCGSVRQAAQVEWMQVRRKVEGATIFSW